MTVDLSDLIEIIQKLVDYMKSINFVLGDHNINLWSAIVALGSLEILSHIFYGVNFNTNKDEEE